MASYVLWLFVVFQVVSGNKSDENEGFMNHLNTGMQIAQNLLGSESVALKVADFVVRAFQTVNSSAKNKRHPSEESAEDSSRYQNQFGEKEPEFNMHEIPTSSPWSHLVRLLRLRPHQISAVAVNALVFVAQMITTFLAGPRQQSKPNRSDDPSDWIFNKNSKKLQELLTTAKNESLPELIEDVIKQQDDQEETSCIRLLVCKITPFVSRMQKAVFGKANESDFIKEVRGAAIMYRHLPSKEEINVRSDICEKKYKGCNLNE